MHRIQPYVQPRGTQAALLKADAKASTANGSAKPSPVKGQQDGSILPPTPKNYSVLEHAKERIDAMSRDPAAATKRQDQTGVDELAPDLRSIRPGLDKSSNLEADSMVFDRGSAKLKGFGAVTGQGMFDQLVAIDRKASDRSGWALDQAASDNTKKTQTQQSKKTSDDKKADDNNKAEPRNEKTQDKKENKTTGKDDNKNKSNASSKKNDNAENGGVPTSWPEAKKSGKYDNVVDWLNDYASSPDGQERSSNSERFIKTGPASTGRRGTPVPDAVAIESTEKDGLQAKYEETKAGLVRPVGPEGRNLPDADTLKSASPTSLPRHGWAINPGTGETDGESGTPQVIVDRGESLKDPPKPIFGANPTPAGPVPSNPTD